MIDPSHRRRCLISGALRPRSARRAPAPVVARRKWASAWARWVNSTALTPGSSNRIGALEHIHRRRVEPRTQVDVGPPRLPLPLDHRRRRLAGEPRGMHHVVVEQNARPHRSTPARPARSRPGSRARRRRRGAGGPPRPEHEVGQTFGPVGEGADDQRLRSGHAGNLRTPAGPRPMAEGGLLVGSGYGCSADFPSSFTIQSPVLISLT